jgi:hypothetical protein
MTDIYWQFQFQSEIGFRKGRVGGGGGEGSDVVVVTWYFGDVMGFDAAVMTAVVVIVAVVTMTAFSPLGNERTRGRKGNLPSMVC